MGDLFCRVRVPYANVTGAVEAIAEKCDKIVVYEHNERQDNIHIHLYLQRCQVSTDTVKNYFKKCGFNAGPKGTGWSFTKATDIGCITYMSKGKLDPCYVKGFTQDEIDECKDRWVERTSETSGKKYQTRLQYIVHETPSQAKKRKNDYVEEMRLELQSHHKATNLEYFVDEHIVEVIIRILNRNHVVFSRYTIRDYYDTLCARQYTDQFVQSMIKFLQPKN